MRTAGQVVLDEEQQRAVEHSTGSLCLLGGPGTGKTTALKERFARLALSPGCWPDRVLLLVPNRAQKIRLQDELTRRLLSSSEVGALIEVPVYTWHGLANHLVSRHYDRLGYSEPPVLLTSPEQWADVREALDDEDALNWPSYKHLLASPAFVDEVADFIIRAQQHLLEDSDFDEIVRRRPSAAEVVRFVKLYRQRLKSRSRIDYPTLLADAAWLIANHDDVRAALHRRFLHVLVEDGQELSLVQQRLLRFITGPEDEPPGRSLVLAADPDSAIETFRGADPEWLGRFGDEYGADIVALATSYRVGLEVGERGGVLLSPMGEAMHRPRRFAGATALELRRYQSLAAEMDAVARELRLAHLRDHVPFERMAILLTSPRALLGPLERALQRVEVPYSVAAPDRALEREASVRAFVALARVALDGPAPDVVAELLRSPLARLSEVDVRGLEREARSRDVSLFELLRSLPDDAAASVRAAVGELLELHDALVSSADRPAGEAFWGVWSRATHYRELERRARKSLLDPANRDLDALVAFARSLGRFVERRRGGGTLKQYLRAMGRADFGSDPWLPPQRARGGVEILSFHAAKGREWDVVAVCGAVEGAIPKGRRATGMFDPFFFEESSVLERARKNEAEDRRVFYVALTRASTRCIVTTSPGPTRKGQPSRFLEELAGGQLEVVRAGDLPPLTFAEAAARYRRALVDPSRPAPERLAALGAVARVCRLDPSCSAARPEEWWWRWEWTEGNVPLQEQRRARDDGLEPGKLRTSYSRISQYENCPLQYLLGVVLGLDPDQTHAMAFGTWIHKAFEEFERGRLADGAALSAYVDELWDDAVFPNRAIARQYRREVDLMIERYLRYLRPGRSQLQEKQFELDFDGHKVLGRIDRVDKLGNNVVIFDYKTGRSVPRYEDAKSSLQLAIYYLAATRDPEIAALGKPTSMQLVYPAAKLVKNDVQKRAQTPEEAEAALEKLPPLIDKILGEEFEPSPEADCTFCRFKPLCPLWPEGKEVPA